MKNRGFTLIELMIVVAIISIVAALTIPLLRGQRPTFQSPIGSTGQIVDRVDMNSPRCVNGVLLKNNEPVVKNGAAVKC